MLLPAKHRICPSAHPIFVWRQSLQVGAREDGGRSIWGERTSSARSWRASPPTSSFCSEKTSTTGAVAMRSASARSPRPQGPTGPSRGARDAACTALEGAGRPRPDTEMALQQRQEVHLPHGNRPRALPQAVCRLDLLHQAHASQRPRRVRGRTVRRHPQDLLRMAEPRARHSIQLPRPDRAARHRLG